MPRFSSYHFTYHIFFFNDTATTEIYTLSLHDALPISQRVNLIAQGIAARDDLQPGGHDSDRVDRRSEEHTSELQSHLNLVCRLLLEKKKKKQRGEAPNPCIKEELTVRLNQNNPSYYFY